MFDCGLIVGKFSPLHNGHVLAIEAAQARCRHLIVLTYSAPEFTGCERARREAWLRALFPRAQVIALDQNIPANDAPAEMHRQFCGQVCQQIAHRQPDAVFTSEDYGDDFAAHLSRQFNQSVAHVQIDRARAQVPISATAIRADIHAHRQFLPPRVYRDFIVRAVFLGAESTGKTTIIEAAARALDAEPVWEFGRTLWVRKGGRLEYTDMLEIGRQQVRDEQAACARATKPLVLCDTSPLTTCFYSHALFGRIDPDLLTLSRRDYDHVFLCMPDFPLVQDGTRADEAFRARQHAFYLENLTANPVKLSGSPQARLAEVCRVLRRSSRALMPIIQ